ncbi:hypothetical protein Tco_1235095 [Tanacetum coccineum]
MVNLVPPAVRSQQSRLSDYQALQRSWFELGRGALAQIDILQRYEALNEDYGELFESHRSCRAVSDRLTETQNQLLDTVRSRNQLSEDHKALQQVHLGCVEKEADLVEKLAAMEKERDDLLDRDREREERIQRLEADLASKTSSLAEAEGAVGTLRGDLERLTVDLSQAEIVRHNYVRQLLPTVGVKVACSEEEAQAFLATAVDYDQACKETFMTEFDSLYDKSYPYMEKLAESFRLPLGDLQNMWPEGTGPTLSGNAEGASTTTDASNIADASDVAIASCACKWDPPNVLRYGPMGVTLGIALGTHPGNASLGHMALDSSGIGRDSSDKSSVDLVL